MTDYHTYVPDWVSPPGETIQDLLEENGRSQAEFAERLRMTPKQVTDLINGRERISPKTGEGLERVLGSRAVFWLARDKQFRARQQEAETLEAAASQRARLDEIPSS